MKSCAPVFISGAVFTLGAVLGFDVSTFSVTGLLFLTEGRVSAGLAGTVSDFFGTVVILTPPGPLLIAGNWAFGVGVLTAHRRGSQLRIPKDVQRLQKKR
jgi:hypothetical protein